MASYCSVLWVQEVKLEPDGTSGDFVITFQKDLSYLNPKTYCLVTFCFPVYIELLLLFFCEL